MRSIEIASFANRFDGNAATKVDFVVRVGRAHKLDRYLHTCKFTGGVFAAFAAACVPSTLLMLLFVSAGFSQRATEPAANQLSAREKAQGWELLFDGKSWTNWTLSRMPATRWWKIEDGWICSVVPPGDPPQQGRRLATLEAFRDFELQFEWKIAPEGNSGVKYRIQRVWRFRPEADLATGRPELLSVSLEALEAGTALGFEYQLTDDKNAPDALDSPSRSSAALYRLVLPRGAGPVIAGTVHASRIRVAGSRFEHWLDGKLVADGNLKSEAIRSVLRSNMEAGVKRFEAATEPRDRYNGLLERVTAQSLLIFDTDQSPIDFQHHYSGICFRRIKVRRLNRGAPADASEGSGGRSVVQFIVDNVRSRSSPVAIRIQSSL